MQPSCSSCEVRLAQPFCDMPDTVAKAFDEIKQVDVEQKGSVLFAEGRPVRGIYILCEGRAKLTLSSENGKRLMLRVAGPGEVLGLGASLSGSSYEVTAELMDNARVAHVRRKDLMKFLRDNPTVCMTVVNMLSTDLHGAYERVRSIGLARTRKPRIQRPRPPMAS